jgi:hypothetical protein
LEIAITEEITINTTISIRMITNCFLSLIFLITWPFKKSSVKVEEEAITNEERVDIDAANTRTIIRPIIASLLNPERIPGMIESKPSAGLAAEASALFANIRPKLPRK